VALALKPSFASTVEIPAAFDRELQRVRAEAGTRRIIQKKRKWSVGVLSAGLFDPPAAFGRRKKLAVGAFGGSSARPTGNKALDLWVRHGGFSLREKRA
jgi:hypothetical protein